MGVWVDGLDKVGWMTVGCEGWPLSFGGLKITLMSVGVDMTMLGVVTTSTVGASVDSISRW